MATGFTSSAATVTSQADLYEKTNTDVKTAIKMITEESKWFRSYPREQITVSGNENRVPLVLLQNLPPAYIPDGGNEAVMSTQSPTHGTFLPVQMNQRFGYTGLAQALTNRARGAMIMDQTSFQAAQAGYSFGRAIGLSTYGTSVGTLAVVKTTGSGGTTQVIALKNAYGSASLVPGTGTEQLTYLSNLVITGAHIALIRSGAIVEFGTVTASPSASSGVGYIDVTFTSSITPTAGDLVVNAMADGDNTITGTDYNNWAGGFTDFLLGGSVLGVSPSSYPKWTAGSTSTASQRLSFTVKEKMINDCWNGAGVKINRFIVGQGTRRNAITGELGSRRYDSAETDLEGDLKPGEGEQFFTSQLALPGVLIGWYDQALRKIELSDLPEDGTSKGIFKLDKVQGKSQIAAGYDYFFQRIPSSLQAMGYASNLSSDS